MKIVIVPIEPIETRYTSQWHKFFPELLKGNISNAQIIQVDGEDIPPVATEGAFLDFSATNIYKSSQIVKISKMIRNGEIGNGDHIIFTDAWHPGIINIKYMKDLLGIDLTLHGLWHAGAYDNNDALGRLIKDKRWVNAVEQAYFHALDHNWFATQDHIKMFEKNCLDKKTSRCEQTGWPMEYMSDIIYQGEKEDLILFPHRIAPEKQLYIFEDLKKQLPQYEFVVCQEQALSKDEYHELLSKAKMVFSANLQETLGISTCIEGPLAGAIPLAPDRLSYTEIFEGFDEFLYPEKWTRSYSKYLMHREDLMYRVIDTMENYNANACKEYVETSMRKYFSADNLLKSLDK